MKNAWFEEVKSDIIARLHGLEGGERYLCDVGFELTVNENNDGSWYCSAFMARQEIAENMDEFGIIAQYMHDELCIDVNPLLDSEKFHCAAMVTLYECAFNCAVCGRDDWNDEIEITPELITEIETELNNVHFNDLF